MPCSQAPIMAFLIVALLAKVFNNIWGTFSFGPENSIFIGAFRGYVRFSSDPEL
jgi:hypothetical protein